MIPFVLYVVVMLLGFAVPATSQLQAGNGRTITAAEYARGFDLYRTVGLPDKDGNLISGDNIDQVLANSAKEWVASLGADARGIQMDPAGKLLVAAGQDEVARKQFAERLGTAGLSIDDQAYTLLLATRVFGENARDPNRMRLALAYLGKLDALPRAVVTRQFQGHVAIAEAYYDAGDAKGVVRHLKKAFSLVPIIPYVRRTWLGYRHQFLLLADVLSGMPEGRAQIDSMAVWLKPFTEPPAELIARDSIFFFWGQINKEEYAKMVQTAGLLGRPAPPIIAHYWLNTDVPNEDPGYIGAERKTMNDGKIRMLALGHYGCPGCLAALPKMDSVRKAVPGNVEVWFVSQEVDVWGTAKCTPDEMAQHLKNFYLDSKGYGLPIAIWIGPRKADVDGGTLNEESPTQLVYGIFGTPTFVLTDGKGLVRHISLGYSEAVLGRSLKYLIAESSQ